MSFNSVRFLVFYTVVVLAFFGLRHRFRWIMLLIASLYFYMSWRAEYVLLILLSGVIDYWASWQMGKREDIHARRPFLILSLCSNLGLLFSFKYFNFLNDSARQVVEHFGAHYPIPMLDVLLPVGISFYTFQTMSYSIEVYWGRMRPEKHFGIYMLYVCYFPQLVAGPIERAQNLLHQFRQRVTFDHARVSSGLKLMAWGLFKKVMIADRVAPMVDNVYNSPGQHGGPAYILATILFAIQIYCDFSGYSDIAIGSARVMGVDLMRNFRSPYFSRNISEFWRRWHISLSTWFRDYVYIPLGGNRTVKWRWYYNLFITFFLSGIWHGANWTFVIWGALHGLYLIFAIVSTEWRDRLGRMIGLDKAPVLNAAVQITITLVLVLLGWVFFRANHVRDAFTVLAGMGSGHGAWFGPAAKSLYAPLVGAGFSDMVLAVAAICVLIVVDILQGLPGGVNGLLARRPTWQRWTVYYGLVGSMVFLGAYYRVVPFIYFQF
ncbi:MAG: MBOAT family protein [Flavobacteriales bacterium]|nr:MBOAT family protein [Flavobacteriales bacterium]MCB9193260.1 MBOAT family protein [Flavobacteriales bacterium]